MKIGSARSDEKFGTSGKAGDQRQTAFFDNKGEVSIQDFYIHKYGWVCLVPRSRVVAEKLANSMILACVNKNIGYSQTDRYGIIKNGTGTKTKTNCDCSSLVRRCVIEASGIDPGDFNTGNEADVLMKTGLFVRMDYKEGMNLSTGTILVTARKGHTAIVTEGNYAFRTYPKYNGTSESIVEALKSVGEKDTSKKHRTEIASANNIDKYTGTAAQNFKLLQLLKRGELKEALK